MNYEISNQGNVYGAPSGYWLWGLAVLPLESLASALACRLNLGYFSLNRQIASQTGLDAETVLSSLGETKYRQEQLRVLTEHLEAARPLTQVGGEVDVVGLDGPDNELVNLGTFGLNSADEKSLLGQVMARHKPQKRLFLNVPDDALAELAGLNRPRSVALGMPRLWLKQQAGSLRAAAEEIGMEIFTLDPQEEIDRIIAKLVQRL